MGFGGLDCERQDGLVVAAQLWHRPHEDVSRHPVHLVSEVQLESEWRGGQAVRIPKSSVLPVVGPPRHRRQRRRSHLARRIILLLRACPQEESIQRLHAKGPSDQ